MKVDICYANDFKGLSEQARRCLFVEDRESWSAATISWGGNHLVVLNQTHSKARTHSNLTHELAHLIIGHEPARVDVSVDDILILHTYDKAQEEQADWLSGCLLLPRDLLVHIQKRRLTTEQATSQFIVSAQMLKYRTNITGVSRQSSRAISR